MLVTVRGITLDIDERIPNSMRFTLVAARCFKKPREGASPEELASSNAEQSDALLRMIGLLFGDDVDRVLDELDSQCGGLASNDDFGAFLKDVLEALDQKN